jgi:hypothetical protein
MDALHFFFRLPLLEQVLLDLFVPPFFALLCWASDTVKSFLWNSAIFKDSPKSLGYLLTTAYVLMITLTIYFHVSR